MNKKNSWPILTEEQIAIGKAYGDKLNEKSKIPCDCDCCVRWREKQENK